MSQLITFEDRTLIKLALEGQSECFTVLMDRHLAAVKKRIRSLVPNVADFDDVLQEVLFKVWLHLATFRAESSFRTWMTSVAINEALQSNRRVRSRPFCPVPVDLDAIVSRVESPHESFVRVESSQAVRGAVEKLSAKHREVLMLLDFNQLTAQEAAQRLQLTVSAVKSRLFQARIILGSELRRSTLLGGKARA